MDPAVDTGFDEGVNEDPNAVNTSSLEAATYGNRIPPELYPDGAPEDPAAANPVPGNDDADIVRAGPLAANGLAHDPSPDPDALPVPPQQFQDAAKDAQEGAHEAAAAADDDEDQDMGDDLFGEGGDDDDDEDMAAAGSAAASPQPAAAAASPQRSPSPNDGLTPAEREHRRRLEYNEEDAVGADGYDDDDDHAGPGAAQMVHTEEVIAQIPLANFSVPAGGKVWHARMPHFLQVATGAFDEETWEPEDVPQGAGRTAAAGGQQESQDAASQDEVKPRTVPDENVIRWRWTKDELGQAIKQSNARIVRWSDGTLSLQLGSELFDMTLALDDSATLTATGAASAAGSGGVNPQTSGLVPSAFDLARGHGLTYLSARHTYAGTPLSETQASVHGTMSFRPATLASQTHRRLAGSIAGRYGRNQASRRGTQKAEMPTVDPEKARQQRERAEVERQKKARREAVKAAGGGATRSGGRGRAGKKATTIEGLDLGSDEDDEDDEDGEGMRYDSGYRRSQPKRGKSGPLNRDYDDDDDGFLAQSDEEMEEASGDREELEEADEAAERAARRRKDRQKRRDYATDSNDDDDDDAAAGAGAGADAAEGTQAAPRRRLVVESDEDE
ncbi:RNA polymerase-associated protein LEO1 [Rhodotorula diobovata]|uniref:RNA polymerase-associated protein LEO1 n=1 Tax=Rhodotorula diobovata TaxID=5288 RepID=A0A5C5G5N2_9BASI|nr:RNA polymerase-associated protein LEO1 [Rhodotorula diobovata]